MAAGTVVDMVVGMAGTAIEEGVETGVIILWGVVEGEVAAVAMECWRPG